MNIKANYVQKDNGRIVKFNCAQHGNRCQYDCQAVATDNCGQWLHGVLHFGRLLWTSLANIKINDEFFVAPVARRLVVPVKHVKHL